MPWLSWPAFRVLALLFLVCHSPSLAYLEEYDDGGLHDFDLNADPVQRDLNRLIDRRVRHEMKEDGDTAHFGDEENFGSLGRDPEIAELLRESETKNHIDAASSKAELNMKEADDLDEEINNAKISVARKEHEIAVVKKQYAGLQHKIAKTEKVIAQEEGAYNKASREKDETSEKAAHSRGAKRGLEIQSELKKGLLHESDTIQHDKATYDGLIRDEKAASLAQQQAYVSKNQYAREAGEAELKLKQAKSEAREKEILEQKNRQKQISAWDKVKKERHRVNEDEDKAMREESDAKNAEARRLEARHTKIQSTDEAARAEQKLKGIDKRIKRQDLELNRAERDEREAASDEQKARNKKHGYNLEIVDLKLDARTKKNEERATKKEREMEADSSLEMHDKADLAHKQNIEARDAARDEQKSIDDAKIAEERDKRAIGQATQQQTAAKNLEQQAEGTMQSDRNEKAQNDAKIDQSAQKGKMEFDIMELKSKALEGANKAKDIAEKVLKGLRGAGGTARTLAKSAPEAMKGPLNAAADAADKIADAGQDKVMKILDTVISKLNVEGQDAQATQGEMNSVISEESAGREGADNGVETNRDTAQQQEISAEKDANVIAYEKEQENAAKFQEESAKVSMTKDKGTAAATGQSADWYLDQSDTFKRKSAEEQTQLLKDREAASADKASLAVKRTEAGDARHDQAIAASKKDTLQSQEHVLKHRLGSERKAEHTEQNLESTFKAKASKEAEEEKRRKKQVQHADDELQRVNDDKEEAETEMRVASKEEQTAQSESKRASGQYVAAMDREKLRSKQYEDEKRWEEQYETKERKEKMLAEEDDKKAHDVMDEMQKAEAKKAQLQTELDENRSKYFEHSRQEQLDTLRTRHHDEDASGAAMKLRHAKVQLRMYKKEAGEVEIRLMELKNDLIELKRQLKELEDKKSRLYQTATRYQHEANAFGDAAEEGRKHGFHSHEYANAVVGASEAAHPLDEAPELLLATRDGPRRRLRS